MTSNDSARQVYISGELVPEAAAEISIFDSAVMLGDSITESTRTFRHEPFRLDDHIKRLYRSLKVARIDPGHSPAEITGITLSTLDANRSLMSEGDDWTLTGISDVTQRIGSDTSGTKQFCSAASWILHPTLWKKNATSISPPNTVRRFITHVVDTLKVLCARNFNSH